MKMPKLTTDLLQHANRASLRRPRFLALLVLMLSMVSTAWLVPDLAQSRASEMRLVTSVAPTEGDHTAAASSGMPLMFIENVGQFDERARFQIRSGDSTFYLSENALWVTLLKPSLPPDSTSVLERHPASDQEAEKKGTRQVNVKLSFVGSSPHPRLESFDRLDTQVSFFTGNNPAVWHTHVPTWCGVRYVDLYPGLDWEITSQNGRLVQRLVARDGSSLSDVRLRVEGMEDLTLEGNHLRLTTTLGDLAFPLPILEGVIHDMQSAVQKVEPGVFDVSAPFASTPESAVNAIQQTSDPNLLYSTFLGGGGREVGFDITVDGEGNAYITGETSSLDFPTTPGAFDPSYGDGPYDAFVAKLSPDGRSLIFATFLGGSGEEAGMGIAVDWSGHIYITGRTYSTDFPTTDGVLDRNLSGGRDAFVIKMNAAGDDLVYGTYLGGSSWDYGKTIEVDSEGNAYVGGFTHGSFPTTPAAAQETFGGAGDGFVAKLNPEGGALRYSTYLGGSSWESIDGIALDDAGQAYVASHTHSTDFPTTPGAWDETCDNCRTNVSTDAAVAKLSADGSEFIYSTLVGGATTPGGEWFASIAVDDAGNAYLIGATSSVDYPVTAKAFQPAFAGGGFDAVITKLNATGNDLLYSTHLGGGGTDMGTGIAIDRLGHAYVTGRTASMDFPTANPLQAAKGDGSDVFVAELNTEGGGLPFSSYLGGSNAYSNGDESYIGGIALDKAGYIYLTGSAGSSDFTATQDSVQPSFGGGDYDAFVVKIDDGSRPVRLYLPIILRE